MGGNLIGATPSLLAATNPTSAIIKTATLSAAIIAADRTFIVGSNPVSIPRAFSGTDWNKFSAKRGLQFIPPILFYSTVIYSASFGINIAGHALQGNHIAYKKMAIAASLPTTYPLSMIHLPLVLSQPAGAQSLAFRYRFLIAAWITTLRIFTAH